MIPDTKKNKKPGQDIGLGEIICFAGDTIIRVRVHHFHRNLSKVGITLS